MPNPRYLEIAADLRSKIENQELKEGEQLPTEKELARDYDAARNTIRDAIGVLKTRQILETQPGRGTFVVKKPVMYQITLTPNAETGFSGGEGQAWIAEVRQQNREATTSRPIVEIQAAGSFRAAALGVDPDESLVGRHQERFIDDTPWSLQTSYYPLSFVDQGASKLLRNEDIEPGTVAYLEKTLGIRQASYRDEILVRQPDKREIAFFNLPDPGSVQVFEHRRTALTTENVPFRYTMTVFPTDRNTFVIEADLPLDEGRPAGDGGRR